KRSRGGTCPAPTGFGCFLVRPLGFVDVDVFGVDHIAGLFVLRAARARPWSAARACARAGCAGLLRSGGFAGLIENLGDLVQRFLEVLGSGAQTSRATFGDGFLRFVNSIFGGL